MSEQEIIEAVQALAIGPEDRLLLRLTGKFSAETLEASYEWLRKQGLGDRVVFMGADVDPIILRATKAEGSTVGQCGDAIQPVLSHGRLLCHLAHGHAGMHSDGQATWSGQ